MESVIPSKQNARTKRSQRKQELIEAKQYALNSALWTGDNVIVANAIQLGVQNLQMNAKRVVYLGLSKIETKRVNEAALTSTGWRINLYAKDFAEIFNIHESNVYELMSLGVDQLLKKIVEFDFIDSATNKVNECKFPWVRDALYIKDEGKIELAFNDLLTPYITRIASKLGGYTIQKIKQSGGIKSVRGWRLFDLLTTQRDTGVLKISTSHLFKALEVGEKMSKDYYDFKRFILEPAIKDIKENAKVNISFEETKSGRRISNLTFRFSDVTPQKRKQEIDNANALKFEYEEADAIREDQSIWHADNLPNNQSINASKPKTIANPSCIDSSDDDEFLEQCLNQKTSEALT